MIGTLVATNTQFFDSHLYMTKPTDAVICPTSSRMNPYSPDEVAFLTSVRRPRAVVVTDDGLGFAVRSDMEGGHRGIPWLRGRPKMN
jgi:hypothetical protein